MAGRLALATGVFWIGVMFSVEEMLLVVTPLEAQPESSSAVATTTAPETLARLELIMLRLRAAG